MCYYIFSMTTTPLTIEINAQLKLAIKSPWKMFSNAETLTLS